MYLMIAIIVIATVIYAAIQEIDRTIKHVSEANNNNRLQVEIIKKLNPDDVVKKYDR